MKIISKAHAMMLLLALAAPTIVAADDNFTSKLSNQSKKNGNDGYYLVRDEVWGDNDCVVDQGKDRINPGEDSTLTIKKGCTWGGIRYKILTVTGDKDMGYLGHSFRNGKFSIDVTSPCQGDCNFIDLNPTQNKAQ